ncbi:DUF2490 domain-containing protein [Hymenobacter sp. HSC-4F20]|uniref:DUF2490 domain-containing protein n=1 Tax=Hymenobacter sp. HSC-4F20 TaxID=2864135 RepID=UPI001C73CDF4|nr:DUF2490 domain-containing protein [Hymenobacter sp. HSC-4F20]MBX0289896.1 DUF2490 domain-containing protein [Hymenobacter sp. HSC-4F20]
MKKTLLLLGCWVLASSGYGQALRLNDQNTLGWLVYSGDHKLTVKWALHTEYQWRRINWVRAPQQQLARLGLVRTLTDRITVSGGYTYFQTHRYGSYPTVPGRPEPEHRLYQDISLKDPLGRLTLTHRLRLEQRWLGTRANEGQGHVQDWEFQNRIRYQLAGQFPLQGVTVEDGEWYLNAFDELFIGFGRNVGDNVFNQNRLSGGVGYQFSDNAKVELNYLNQISQHAEPDAASGRPVFEINHGFRLNILYDLDFTHDAVR